MQDILVETAAMRSAVHCGAGAFETYVPRLRGRQLFVVSDSHVFQLYRRKIEEAVGEDVPVFVLPAGEKSKNQGNLMKILRHMLACGMKRNGCVLAFGGGVVGDIAGLAASLYMRGVHFVQIPTTLLSQVDSSVGGKTAVDFGGVKNVVGTFYQPEEVVVDPQFLSTLPPRELRCGLGEIIKYGALDAAIFQKLLKNRNNLFDAAFLDGVAVDCIAHKARVVALDERDVSGARKTLNLGHTTGHALELYYGRKSHGEFVLIGMYYELYIARKLGICGGQYAEDLERLIYAVIKKAPAYGDIERAAALASYDKKNSDSNISLVVPQSEGVCTEVKLSAREYAAYLAACRDCLREGA